MEISDLAKRLLLVPGKWDSELHLRRAEVLHYAHLFTIIFGTTYLFIPATILAGQTYLVLLTIVVACIGSVLLRGGNIRLSGIWTTGSLWVIFTAGSLTEGGIHSSSFAANIALVVFAGLAYGLRMMVVIAVATILAGAGTIYLLQNNMLPIPAITYSEVNILADFTIYIAITSLFMSIAVRRIDSSTRKYEAELKERKRTEESLREREERYRSLYENSNVGIYRTTPDGRILLANPALIRMLEYSSLEELTERNLDHEGFEPDYQRSTFLESIEKSGEIKGWESAWQTKAGKILFIRENARMVRDLEGSTLYYDGVVEDISDRKQLEERRLELERQLLQAQKMESLGVLAGGIAHEFNNLLVGILGNISLVRHRLNPSDRNGIHLQQAEKAAERAAELTQQMLAYSGKGHFLLTIIDLNGLILQNLELLRGGISKTSTFTLALATEPVLVEASAPQIQQLLLNLITNASEALSGQGGSITLKSGSMECDVQYLAASRVPEKPAPGCFAYLEVTDTGHGMNEETLSRLFDPFYTTKFTGRGLGMSAALGIVQGHKGAILVKSTPNYGTTIRVLFPAAQGEDSITDNVQWDAASETLSASPGRMILVADDEELVRDFSLEIVKELGFHGLGAVDGEEAVKLFQEHSGEIACVILDVTMPKMDGLKACEMMRSISPEVGVILCSGYDRQNVIEQFQGTVPPWFLSKPYRPLQLKDKITEVLRETGARGRFPEGT